MVSKLDINVIFDDTDGLRGECCWTDDPDKPREFEILVDRNLPLMKVMITLCHEMVHVKQYARTELTET